MRETFRLVSRNWLTERTALGCAPSLVALLEAAERGSKPAADALFSALYSELRRLARHELARHGAPMTLSATTLLHKAYIEIAGQDGTSFPDRNRFMGYAARVMRGLIIDHARSRQAQKRAGQFEKPQKNFKSTTSASAGSAFASSSNAPLIRSSFSPSTAFSSSVPSVADSLTVDEGTPIIAVDQGGEPHTFTEVAQFGGGFIPQLNGPDETVVPECAMGFSRVEVARTRILQGSQLQVTGLSKGTHRFQCCIHPWMRTTVVVK